MNTQSTTTTTSTTDTVTARLDKLENGQFVVLPNGTQLVNVMWFESEKLAKEFLNSAKGFEFKKAEGNGVYVIMTDVKVREFLKYAKEFASDKTEFARLIWAGFVCGCKDSLDRLMNWFKSIPSLVSKGIQQLKDLFSMLKSGDHKTWVNTLLVFLLVCATVTGLIVCPVAVYGLAGVVGITWLVLYYTGKLDGVIDWYVTNIDKIVDNFNNKKVAQAQAA